MSGIPLALASIVSGRTREGMVELTLGDQKILMDLAKAREVRGMLDGAIEAAVSDELVVKFLTTKIGLTLESATLALRDFWQLRQGSFETVFPS